MSKPAEDRAFTKGQRNMQRRIVAYLENLAEKRQQVADETGNKDTGLLATDAIALATYIGHHFAATSPEPRGHSGAERER